MTSNRLQRGVDRAMSGVQTLCGLCIIGMALAVTYEIVARSLFGEPTIWAQEVSVYLLIAVAFLGLAPTHAAGEHIEIDLLARRMSARVRRAVRALILAAIAGYALVAAWGGLGMVQQSMKFGRRSLTLLAVPVWMPQLLIPVGMGLLAVVTLAGLWTLLKGNEAKPTDD